MKVPRILNRIRWWCYWRIQRWADNRRELRRQARTEAELDAQAQEAWERERPPLRKPRLPVRLNTQTLTDAEAMALFESRGIEE